MSRIKISRVVANVLDNSFLTVLSNNIVATLLTTSNVAEGANLYFNNTRARAAVGAVGSNLVYYEANGNFQVLVSGGGGGAVDSVNGQTGTVIITTANVAESGNLYFTNTRARAAVGAADSALIYYEANGNFQVNVSALSSGVTSVNGETGTVVLTTANIAESGNLYYTDARVWANVGANLGNLNSWTSANSSNIGNLNSWIGTLTTSGVAEGANLYFTNNRVYAALYNAGSNAVPIAVQSIFVQDGATNGLKFDSPNAADYANITVQIDAGATYLTFYVGDNTADLFKFYAPSSNNGLQFNDQIVWHAGNDGAGSGLDADLLDNNNSSFYTLTTNHTEGTNLFFTNTRVRAAVGTASANAKGISYVESTGEFSLADSSVTAGTYGNATLVPSITIDRYGRITAASNVASTGGSGAVDSVNGQTGTVVLTTANVAEDANLYFTNTRARAAVGAVGSNLVYYEANGNFQVIVSSTGGGAVDSVNGQTGTVVLTTANIAESGNLYFTNDRVWANVGANIGNINSWIPSLTTASIAEADPALYFTNTRVRAAVGTAAANAKGISYVESTGQFSLADSGVTAAVYGGASQIPAVVVDRYGRITAASNVALSGSGTVTGFNFTGGIITVANPNTVPSLTVAGTSGGVVYFSGSSTWASSGVLGNQALMVGGGTGGSPSTVTTGTGVVSALGVSVGSSGAFVVNGGALGTPSSGTVTNLTGTASININGTVGATTPTTGAFTTISASGTITALGALNLTGLFTANTTTEVVTALSGATGVVTHNTALSAVFYHTSPAANFTANFTNVPTTDNRVINVTLVIVQGATPYICNAVQINGAAQTIRWQGGSAPTGTGSRWEVMNFSLIDVGGSYVVLGALYSHG